MKTRFLKGVVLGAVVAGLTVTSTAAVAGTGIGGVFNLGAANTVNASTVLQGSTSGHQQLRVVNNATTGAGTTGIGIHTAPNEPPLAVDSKIKVSNLNADLLDGQSSTAFVAGGGHISSARLVETIPGADATVLSVPTFGTIEATCAATGFGLLWRNRTNPSTELDVWVVHDGVTRFVTQPTTNDATQMALDVKGDELFTEQVGRTGHTATITTAAHWSPTGCIFHAQAVTQ
jgi:hypothetical protein